MNQMRLDAPEPPEPPAVPEHRVRALAGVIAGFRWPGRKSFDALPKPHKEAATRAARAALEALALEPD